MKCGKSHLILLLMSFLTQMLFCELLTEEEVGSLIESGKCYAAGEVKTIVLQIIQIADEEIVKTAKEAVKEAVIPLQAEIFVLNQKVDDLNQELQDKDKALYWIIPLCVAGGLAGGFILGGLLF